MLGGSRASLLSRACPRLGRDHIPGNKQGEHLSPPIAPPPGLGTGLQGCGGERGTAPYAPTKGLRAKSRLSPPRGSRPLPALAGRCRGRQAHCPALLPHHVPALPAGTRPHTLTTRRPALTPFPRSSRPPLPPRAATRTRARTYMCSPDACALTLHTPKPPVSQDTPSPGATSHAVSPRGLSVAHPCP